MEANVVAKIPEFSSRDELRKALEKSRNKDGFYVKAIADEDIAFVDKNSNKSKEDIVNQAIQDFENVLDSKLTTKPKAFIIP